MFSYDALYINSGSLYFDGTDVSCLSRRLNNIDALYAIIPDFAISSP